MSGQDYVYIVWRIAPDRYLADEIVTTLPTKYQAKYAISGMPAGDIYRIQRWRHGDLKGYWCD